MIMMFLIIPLIISSILTCIIHFWIGASFVNAFGCGAIVSIIVGILFGIEGNGKGINNDFFWSIVYWVAGAFLALAWIIGIAISFYGA